MPLCRAFEKENSPALKAGSLICEYEVSIFRQLAVDLTKA